MSNGDRIIAGLTEALDYARGHNRTPTADAEDLLDVFSRVPDEIDADTVGRAITLAKQMKLAADELAMARLRDAADLRERLADLERPYKLAHERLEEARQTMLARLGAWLKKAGKRQEKNEFGLHVYQKRSVGFEIEDETKLPLGCWKTVPDHDGIARMIEDGLEVPGVRLIETTKTIVV